MPGPVPAPTEGSLVGPGQQNSCLGPGERGLVSFHFPSRSFYAQSQVGWSELPVPKGGSPILLGREEVQARLTLDPGRSAVCCVGRRRGRQLGHCPPGQTCQTSGVHGL